MATKVSTQPVDEVPVTVAGVMGKSGGGNDDFYNRILIEPSALDLGNVISAQTRPVSVWNGFFGNRTLSGFGVGGTGNITVVEPVSTPYTLRPLQELIYTIQADVNGPPSIDANLNWMIDDVLYRAVVVGRRVIVFPFGPDWKNQVTESLEWKTDILRSFNGTEQRRSLRTKARRSFEYRMMAKGQDAALFDNLLWGWQNRMYAIPVWTDKVRLVGDHAAGTVSLAIPTETYSFAEGGMAILIKSPTEYEVASITSVTSSSIGIARPLEKSWPENTLVYPAEICYLPTSVPVQRLTGGVLTATISAKASPVEANPYTPSAVAPSTYKGVDVLTRQPNWIRPLDQTAEFAYDLADQGFGAVLQYPNEEFPRVVRRYSWLLRDRNQILAFRELLNRLRGQAKTVWIPSWHLDFQVVQQIGAANLSIKVKDNGFNQMVGLDAARNHLCLRTEDGQTFYREITGVSILDGVTTLTIDSPLGVTIPTTSVKALHVLMRNRLATDKVDIAWRSNQVATIETTFTTVLQ